MYMQANMSVWFQHSSQVNTQALPLLGEVGFSPAEGCLPKVGLRHVGMCWIAIASLLTLVSQYILVLESNAVCNMRQKTRFFTHCCGQETSVSKMNCVRWPPENGNVR